MVKRYDLGYQCDGESGRCWTDMEAAKDGDYVSYADYAKLEADNAALREAVEKAPHDFVCASFRCARCNVSVVKHSQLIHRLGHDFQQQECNCWKRAALAQDAGEVMK